MIVSVDHGNKSIKTPNYIFTSGVIEAEDRPGMNVDYRLHQQCYRRGSHLRQHKYSGRRCRGRRSFCDPVSPS